jgi:hypothetical protein
MRARNYYKNKHPDSGEESDADEEEEGERRKKGKLNNEAKEKDLRMNIQQTQLIQISPPKM